jgi:hypothetical protein
MESGSGVVENKPLFDEVYFSRIGFIFISFVVITSGYVSEILSCQMRYVLETNPYFRHFLGVLLFFVFIMMEGGWSFNKEEDEKFSNNWASGNVVHSGILALGLYIVFVISSKSQLMYNAIFFALMLVIYLINTQRSYLLVRGSISQETSNYLLMFENGMAAVGLIVLVAGFIDYFIYQSRSHKNDFSLEKFILGAHECTKVSKLKQ